MKGLTDLDEHILACLQKDKTKEVSKNCYVMKLRHIIKVSNMPLLKFCSNSKRALTFINNQRKNIKTRQCYVAAITSALRRCRRLRSNVPIESIAKWHLAAKKLNDQIKTSYSKQIAGNKKELHVCVPWPEVVAKRDILEPGSIERLFLGCYSLYIVPLWKGWHRVLLVTNKNACLNRPRTIVEPNFLFLPRDRKESGILNFGDCKVSRHSIEPFRIRISPALCNEIRNSLKVNPREWLFATQSGDPYTSNHFSGWASRCLHRLFPDTKAPSISMLRKSFLRHMGIDKMMPEQQQELAKLMCYSTEKDCTVRTAANSQAWNTTRITIEILNDVQGNSSKKTRKSLKNVKVITI